MILRPNVKGAVSGSYSNNQVCSLFDLRRIASNVNEELCVIAINTVMMQAEAGADIGGSNEVLRMLFEQ